MSNDYRALEPLTKNHDTKDFDCGEESLNIWLQKYALTNQASGFSKTFVVTQANKVVGYYALATGSISREDAPVRIAHGAPDPIPVLLLGRLAIDQKHQGSGLGGGLLKDAILRTLGVAEQVGIRALLAHALDEQAAAFYARHDFDPSHSNPLHMLLMLKNARRLITS